MGLGFRVSGEFLEYRILLLRVRVLCWNAFDWQRDPACVAQEP